MGKAGRIACIFVPYAMTLVALVLLIIVELGGKSTGGGLLSNVYAWQADFSNVSTAATTDQVGQAVQRARASGLLYQIHIYNYCSTNATNSAPTYCSNRQNGFVFDFVDVWHLLDTASATKRQSPYTSPSNSVSDAANSLETKIKAIFGQGVVDTLQAYETAGRWMSITFQVALWTSVGTAVVALLAIFSRWGSLLTWILSTVSSLFSFAAALISTIIFGTLVGTLKEVLGPHNASITLGTTFLAYVWISTALSIGATSFWLFSVCCCSGKSNPHHRSNRGGLWQAEPKNAYHPRGMRVEQTGGYQRVSSPYVGAGDERVPLHDYPAPMAVGGAGHLQHDHADAYEPYRYHK